MPYTLSVITDEVSPELAAGLKFAREEKLTTVDIRSIGGVNFLSLDARHQRQVAAEVRDAGLEVGCLATPLFKWPRPGTTAGNAGDQFGFDAKGRSDAELFEDACEAAALLGTRNLRIFSYLTYDGFENAHLEDDYGALLALAEKYDLMLHVENEPVCNVASVGQLASLCRHFDHPRLRALLDIGNAASAGAPATPAELSEVMPYVDMMHFKDYAKARRAHVAMGEGDVPFADLLPTCWAAAGSRPLMLVIETHVPGDQPGATRRSVAGVRRLAGL